MDGPDHKASLEPAELKAMVKAIRNIELAISGSGEKEVSESEMKNIIVARKSIHLNNAMKAGQQIQKKDLVMKRPGDGISPMKIENIIGLSVAQDLQKDHKLELKDLKN
jgi:N-acetylneuraminate synthase/N,N'-diacetyllegionaminate synthase